MFDDKQTKLLARPLAQARVRPLEANGRPVLRDGKPVYYMEAWDLIEQANAIFGFGNWSRETVSVEAIHAPVMRENERDAHKSVVVASFWAKVRITVTDGSRSIVREGCGAATSYQKTMGESVEMAIKSAETDAMKRALMTFGNQFGLALYDKEHRNVGREERAPLPNDRRAPIDVGFTDVSAESGRESAPHSGHRTPESAPPHPSNTRSDLGISWRAASAPPHPSNTQRALATLEPRPNGHHKPNGGMRY
jgi:DNA recombination protein Rad52